MSMMFQKSFAQGNYTTSDNSPGVYTNASIPYGLPMATGPQNGGSGRTRYQEMLIHLMTIQDDIVLKVKLDLFGF
jgi:hypothetical protein